jgi:hypothetical protein
MADKYQNFSDNTMKDRLAFHSPSGPPQPLPDDPSQQESVFTSSGWDKYYYFSDPANGVGLHPTARQGRNRPSMIGPQTFQTEAFSSEQVAKARSRLEKKGARTTYTDSYSQIPRSSTAMFGPVPEVRGHDLKGSLSLGQPSALARSASHTLMREPSASELIAGPLTAMRLGPHWPPPGPERPDPIKTRQMLFQGTIRTVVDLHATDRKAPGAMAYTFTRS